MRVPLNTTRFRLGFSPRKPSIWGYPHLRKPPYNEIGVFMGSKTQRSHVASPFAWCPSRAPVSSWPESFSIASHFVHFLPGHRAGSKERTRNTAIWGWLMMIVPYYCNHLYREVAVTSYIHADWGINPHTLGISSGVEPGTNTYDSWMGIWNSLPANPR